MSVSALAFLVLFVAGVALALIRYPILGLHTYMLTFYAAPANAWWGAELPEARWTLIAAAVTLVSLLMHGEKDTRQAWHSHATVRTLMVFTVFLWIQMLWAISPDNQLFLAILFTKYVVMFAVVYGVLCDKNKILQFSMAHVVGCLIWGYAAYRNPGSGRLEQIGNADVTGSAFASMHMSTALAFAGFLFLGLSNWAKWLAVASIPFILNAIILMATRAAFVGLLAVVPVAIYFAPKKQRKLVVICVALGGVLGMSLVHDIFLERMSTIVVADGKPMEESAASRFDIARANLRMFSDYPLGVGHRGNDILSPQYMPDSLLATKDGERIRSSHNSVMAVLVDHGLIGLLLFAAFHLRLVRTLLRLTNERQGRVDREIIALCAALITSFAIYWVNAQFSNMIKAEVVIWIAAIAAAVEALRSPSAPVSHRGRVSPTSARRLRPRARPR